MKCKFCGKDAVYKCSICGNLLCAKHTKISTMCTLCVKQTSLKFVIAKVRSDKEKRKIQDFVQRFWGELKQLTFDRKFVVAKLPAYIAKVKNKVIGFSSFAEEGDSIIIVALGILPRYQGSGVSKGLIRKIEAEAKKLRRTKLLVSTSNDDLPALAFYQSIGFQIYEVKTDTIAEKHGAVVKGIGGLPVRDELRLQKILY